MNARAWQALRARILAAQSGLCALRCRSGSVLLDVVTLDPDGDPRAGWVGLCRSCRCKRDGRKRGLKAAATRRARAAQVKMFGKGRAA